MPATDSPALIVARFLRSNNYNETYNAFCTEAGLSPDAGNVSKGDLTLEKLLEEKKAFDLSINFEKLGVQDDAANEWKKPSPETASQVSSLPGKSNVLSVSGQKLKSISENESVFSLLATTADRRLQVLDALTGHLRDSLVLHDAPVLSCAVFRQKHLITASMSGQVTISDVKGHVIEQRRDHNKYVVKVIVHDDGTHPLVATASWDNKVLLYRPSVIEHGAPSLGEPSGTIDLPSKPETILFVNHPDTHRPILLLTRTDSSFLYYYTTDHPSPQYLGRQNLAPHSNAWVAFTPSAVALSPHDPLLAAIALSTVPHMKLIIVQLLIPPTNPQPTPPPSVETALRTSLLDDPSTTTPSTSSHAWTALKISDREHAAIRVHCTTLAPQTAYSTPAVAWRPDGSGLWVNGDDGAIRGIEASTGRVVVTLREQQGGHEEGSKVRCLWAGWVENGDGGDDDAEQKATPKQEILVSGGFDQKLIIWKLAA